MIRPMIKTVSFTTSQRPRQIPAYFPETLHKPRFVSFFEEEDKALKVIR